MSERLRPEGPLLNPQKIQARVSGYQLEESFSPKIFTNSGITNPYNALNPMKCLQVFKEGRKRYYKKIGDPRLDLQICHGCKWASYTGNSGCIIYEAAKKLQK